MPIYYGTAVFQCPTCDYTCRVVNNRFYVCPNCDDEIRLIRHLKHVYLVVSFTLLTCVIGTMLQMHLAPIMSTPTTLFLAAVCICSLFYVKRNGNRLLQFLSLQGYAIVCGFNLYPTLAFAMDVSPSVVPVALISTLAIFIAFSSVTMIAQKRIYVDLGGTLLSISLVFLWLKFLATVTGSTDFCHLKDIFGLTFTILFLLYNNQRVAASERWRDEDEVFVRALINFMSIIQIFKFTINLLSGRQVYKLIPVKN